MAVNSDGNNEAATARPAVHHHGAGTANADAAGVAVGQRRGLVALNFRHHVEDGLVRAAAREALEAATFCAAPDLYG
jgi:hypothetical protein